MSFTIFRPLALALALATLSVGADAVGQGTSPNSDAVQSQPAPIERAYPQQDVALQANQPMPPARVITISRPIAGVTVRVDANTSVETVSANASGAELRIVSGVANVSVYQPENTAALILIDLPGGQTAVMKNGLYSFNAGTDVVSVLKGEADVYPGTAADGIRVKEEQQFAFGSSARPAGVSSREELMADYLPVNAGNGDGPTRGPAPYGDGFYGPPVAYAYPYGFYGYPYGYGYPFGFGFRVGFGYYGGYRVGYHGHW